MRVVNRSNPSICSACLAFDAVLAKISLCKVLVVESFGGGRAEVADFEFFAFEQHVLHLQVSMSYRWLHVMHVSNTRCYVLQDEQNLLLIQLPTKFLQQIN